MEGKETIAPQRFFTRAVFFMLLLVIANGWLLLKVFGKDDESLAFDVSPPEIVSLLARNGQELTWDRARTILILGRGGEGNNAPDLTDTVILIYADPHDSLKIISLPRDLLVRDDAGNSLKLNALWSNYQESENAVSMVKDGMHEVTGLAIDRIVIFDLATVEKIIKELDGITVLVKDDIYDTRFPKATGGYETFALQGGWRYLSAADALRFVRTRNSPRGDFDRIGRQQELLRGLKGKVGALNPVWDFSTLWSLYNLVQEEVITDLTLEDARNIWILGRERSVSEIDTMNLADSDLLETRAMPLGGINASVVTVKGDPFDYSGVQEEIRKFIDQ